MKKNFYKHYVFLKETNKLIEEKIVKFNDINIIINIDDNDKKSIKNENNIIKFAKKNKIPFLIKNNIKKCFKFNSAGIYIDATNKKIIKTQLFKRKFIIIGTAHNQLEYYFKKRQNCKIIALSPIFHNPKFSINKILGATKFNLVSRIWKTDLCALGGVNESNIKKIKITKASAIAFQRYITK
jgi:thiamine-phosphate pyrophosphorylase